MNDPYEKARAKLISCLSLEDPKAILDSMLDFEDFLKKEKPPRRDETGLLKIADQQKNLMNERNREL